MSQQKVHSTTYIHTHILTHITLCQLTFTSVCHCCLCAMFQHASKLDLVAGLDHYLYYFPEGGMGGRKRRPSAFCFIMKVSLVYILLSFFVGGGWHTWWFTDTFSAYGFLEGKRQRVFLCSQSSHLLAMDFGHQACQSKNFFPSNLLLLDSTPSPPPSLHYILHFPVWLAVKRKLPCLEKSPPEAVATSTMKTLYHISFIPALFSSLVT